MARSKKIHFQCLSSVVKSADDGGVYIEGYANRKTIDRSDEIIEHDAWFLDDYKKNPVILYNHGMDAKLGATPIGKCEKIDPREDGLFVKVKMSGVDDPDIKRVRDLVKEGMLRAFSVGFNCRDSHVDEKGIRRIKKADLFEISVVGIPMNQDSLFSITGKMLESNSIEQIRAKICEKKGATGAVKINKKMHKYINGGNVDREVLIEKMSLESGISEDVIKSLLIGDEDMSIEVENDLDEAVTKACACQKAEDMTEEAEAESEPESEDAADAEEEDDGLSDMPEDERKFYESFLIDFIGAVRPQLVQEDVDMEFEEALGNAISEKISQEDIDSLSEDSGDEESKHFTENNPDHHKPGYRKPNKKPKKEPKYEDIFKIPGFDYSARGQKKPEVAKRNQEAEKKFFGCFSGALSLNRGSIFSRIGETEEKYKKAAVKSVLDCGGKYKKSKSIKQANQEGVTPVTTTVPAAKTGAENADFGSPFLEAQKQTNIFLGQLIAEVQKLSAKMDQSQGAEQVQAEPTPPPAPPAEENQKAALDYYNERLENCIKRLKALGA